jgi:hypothetical protein
MLVDLVKPSPSFVVQRFPFAIHDTAFIGGRGIGITQQLRVPPFAEVIDVRADRIGDESALVAVAERAGIGINLRGQGLGEREDDALGARPVGVQGLFAAHGTQYIPQYELLSRDSATDTRPGPGSPPPEAVNRWNKRHGWTLRSSMYDWGNQSDWSCHWRYNSLWS